MPRYKLLIEYDGTAYAGWQRQDGPASVQGAIEAAIKGFSGEEVGIRGAGRTDTGVHARGQVAHVDLTRDWPVETVRNAINAHLGMARETVAVLDAEKVADDFDARFSAKKRHYLYRYICRRAPLVLERDRAWWLARPLDAEAMHDAAQALVGKHDFTTFRSVHCQSRSPVKSLDRLDVSVNASDGTIELRASAQSFLHNQIRSFAGTMKLVGEGKWNRADVEAALEACDRSACGAVAPPCGLYFMQVDY